MTIGERIKKRREELGLSQETLAERLGYKSKSSINKIELNQRDLPQSKIKMIADALGIHKSDGGDFTPHATRHTFASRAHKAGMNPLVLKKIIGHSPKADVTEKVYIHIDGEQLRDGMSLLDKTS